MIAQLTRVALLLAMTLAAAGAALAQPSPGPMPAGAARGDWFRAAFAEALDGVLHIDPSRTPDTFIVRTSQAELPFFIVSLAELPPDTDVPSAANQFASGFRAHCGTWRPLGEKTEGERALAIWGIDCPAMPSGGLYYWVMMFRDANRLQRVAVGASLPKAALIRARFNPVAARYGLPLYPVPASLAEAMVVQHAYGGETVDYNPADTSQPAAGRAVHRSAMLALTGRPGEYVVEAPSCAAVVVKVFEDGPPRRQISEERIDLDRLGSLATRNGLHFRLRAGRYGERISTLVERNPPLVDPLEVQEGEMPPSASDYPIIEALLDVRDRFCTR